MKLFHYIAALLLLVTTPLFAATVQPIIDDPFSMEYTMPEWSAVGHDTCKQNPGCTITWAMDSFEEAGVLPPAIAVRALIDFMAADIALAAGEAPTWQTYHVCHGDVVASSFSNREGKLTTVRQIKATFADCTPGLGWTYFDYRTGKSYEVFRVTECGNYTVRLVTPTIAGYVSTPLLAALVPHRSYGFGHFSSGGSSSGGSGANPHVDGHCTFNCSPVDHPDPDPETPAPVPLPASGLLMTFGLLALAFVRRRIPV